MLSLITQVNGVAEELKDKRIKVDMAEEVESKITHEQPQQHKNNNINNKENSPDTSKDNNSKISEVQKPDFTSMFELGVVKLPIAIA